EWLSSQCVHAPQGVLYLPLMYPRPHLIWVAGLVFQSSATEAILLPGKACGIPYAPFGLAARWFQPLSLFQMLLRHGNWSIGKPASSVAAQPVARLPTNSWHESGIGPLYGTVAPDAFALSAAFLAITRWARSCALPAALRASVAALPAASDSASRCQ